MTRHIRYRTLGLALVLPFASGCSDDSPSAAAAPNATPDAGGGVPGITVTGPITTGTGTAFTTSGVALGDHGYGEKEFFYEGKAKSYTLSGDMTMDGMWNAVEADSADFKSRLVVRRPDDASKFNGSVIVEWLNVSGGVDADPGFTYIWEEVVREGYAWVGVSAQKQGIEGGGFSLLPNPPPALKAYDPDRYGTLSHPGDGYSFDIYTLVAEVVRNPGEVDVLDGLEPERVIAFGESQSAMRLVTYVDAVHPLAKAYDGFFIHSRGGSGTALSNDASIGVGGTPVLIRTDLDEPVFQFLTETDVLGLLAFKPARQPDTDKLRSWEVAGTAHADARVIGGQASSLLSCAQVNDGPQHFVIKAAVHALNQWLVDGTLPAKGALLESNDANAPITDEHGNTLGGIRTPDVDVPIALLSGMPASGATGGIVCSLFGQTVPFTADKLAALYPSHTDYVDKVKASALAARNAGFLLAPEEATMVAEAEAAPVPQ
jgi:hypothetical protein